MTQQVFIIRAEDFPEDNLKNLLSMTAERKHCAYSNWQEKYLISELYRDENLLLNLRIESKELFYNKAESIEQLVEHNNGLLNLPEELGSLKSIMRISEILGSQAEKSNDGWDYESPKHNGIYNINRKPIWARILTEAQFEKMNMVNNLTFDMVKSQMPHFLYYCTSCNMLHTTQKNSEIRCVKKDKNENILFTSVEEAQFNGIDNVLVFIAED